MWERWKRRHKERENFMIWEKETQGLGKRERNGEKEEEKTKKERKERDGHADKERKIKGVEGNKNKKRFIK